MRCSVRKNHGENTSRYEHNTRIRYGQVFFKKAQDSKSTGFLFPNAKLAKDSIENVVGIDGTDDAANLR